MYPEYDSKASLLINGVLKQSVKNLWDELPIFRDLMSKVPTLHIPNKKDIIEAALKDSDFMVATKTSPNYYWYKV